MSEEIDQINDLLTRAQVTSHMSAEVPASSRARMLGNIRNRANAPAPEGTYTVAQNEADWQPFTDGIVRQVLVADQGDGAETVLYRLDPGAKFLSHAHTHQETCWVVEGELLVGDHLVQAGEMHVADIGFEHPEIVARTNALLLIRSQVYLGPLTPT